MYSHLDLGEIAAAQLPTYPIKRNPFPQRDILQHPRVRVQFRREFLVRRQPPHRFLRRLRRRSVETTVTWWQRTLAAGRVAGSPGLVAAGRAGGGGGSFRELADLALLALRAESFPTRRTPSWGGAGCRRRHCVLVLVLSAHSPTKFKI